MHENLTVGELVGGLRAYNQRAGSDYMICLRSDGRCELRAPGPGRSTWLYAFPDLEGLVEFLGSSPVRLTDLLRRTADNADQPVIARPNPE